jgi:hypothetical protein
MMQRGAATTGHGPIVAAPRFYPSARLTERHTKSRFTGGIVAEAALESPASIKGEK